MTGAGTELPSLLRPARRLTTVRKGNARRNIIKVVLFTIPLFLSDPACVAGPKKLQVRDDIRHMQR
jgi:hypothetical protein